MVLFPTLGKITQGKIMITHDFIPQYQTLLVKITHGKITQGKISQGKLTHEDYPWYCTPNLDYIRKG